MTAVCNCGAIATYRTGMALLGPEYGCGFFCADHVPRVAERTPIAIYRLLVPGTWETSRDPRIQVLWPSVGYEDWPRCPKCGDRVACRVCVRCAQ